MKHRYAKLIITFIMAGLFSLTLPVFALPGTSSEKMNLTISTADNKPLYLDRLIHVALKDIGYQATMTTSASLQQGYTITNNGERDGVLSATPDMESIYPNLVAVPVEIDYSTVSVFLRSDSNLSIKSWSDLAGLRVGILTQRVYIEKSIPEDALPIAKETIPILFNELSSGEVDVIVLSLRSRETPKLPPNVVNAGSLETMPEYLYMHKSRASLIPQITKSLRNVLNSELGKQILNDMPVSEIYSKKTVLHIMSSTLDNSREDQLSAKLKEHFKDDMSIEWYSVELNSRRFSEDPSRLVYFAQLLRRDCATRNVAAIIVSGEYAMDFLKDYYMLFFKNVPVIFYGISEDYASTLAGDYGGYFTGIVEHLAAYDTAYAALGLFPDTKNIFVVNDYMTEGRAYRSVMENQLSFFSDRVNVEYSADISRGELFTKFSELPNDSLVFFGSYFCDANGQYLPLNEMQRLLENVSNVPIITLYSTDIAFNAIGGKCLDYESYGESIATMLTRLLGGEEVSDMPFISDPEGYSRWVFDKNILDKWGVKESSLPAGSQILNKMPSVWEANPKFAYSMAALLFISAVIVIVSLIFIRRDKILQKKLYDSALAAEESSRMKSVFLANMSHEIRTPMNSIIGFSELALDDTIPPKTRDYLDKIRKSSEGLLQLINDILDISKIEAGKIELEKIPFDMREIFRICQIVTTPKALEKGLTLFCYTEPTVNKTLIGDPTRLGQALLNLLSNAVKFTNTGMVKLLSAIIDSTDNSITMRFEVKDSGIGLSPDQIQKIFIPFSQGDSTTTRKYGGTGLGLSITKNIIELMGGELKVESTLGLGSKFSFELTFDTTDENPILPNDKFDSGKLEKPSFSGEEVLICEDNAMNQQVICDNLARVGLKTAVAINGLEGVELVRKRIESGDKPFDLIFMDIYMPVMDGLEAAKQLGLIGNKTPIIALTANIMANDKETYRLHGIPDCLGKPFSAQDLWNCLLKYLTPSGMDGVDMAELSGSEKRQRKRLLLSFIQDNQTTYEDICSAIREGDYKLAHRLSHTLKGVAGLIGEAMLQDSARAVEDSLANCQSEVSEGQMDLLKFNLQEALGRLAPLLTAEKVTALPEEVSLDKVQTLELLDKLDVLLANSSFDCLDYTDELASIPDTGLLIDQIERFDFEPARKTLSGIRRLLEEDDE